MANATNLSLFGYPEMPAEEQGSHANALLGLLFEKEILYQPSYTKLVDDEYAGFWLSWFVNHCRYGESIELQDDEILNMFGFSQSRWNNIRRLLKNAGFLKSSRKKGITSYSLNEKFFSDEAGKIVTTAPLIPVDRISAAAMLAKGLSMTDVLVFSIIRQHLSVRDLQNEETGDYSTWQLHDADQRSKMPEWSEDTILKSIHRLYKAKLLEVVLDSDNEMIRYRINYDEYGNLTYQYVHDGV